MARIAQTPIVSHPEPWGMSLRDDLLDIGGVGEVTADAIEDVLDDHETGDVPSEVYEALDYLEAGQPGYAAKYLRRLVDE